MSEKKKVIIKASLTLLFMIGYSFVSDFILHPLLIKDECDFHNGKASTIVSVLFDFPSYEGNHPVPAI